MINNNVSGIFRNNRMGGFDESQDQGYNNPQPVQYQQQQPQHYVEQDNGADSIFRPINFEEKIMGGRNVSNFMQGKMTQLDGSYNYAKRVDMLLGTGEFSNNSTQQNNIRGINKMDYEKNVPPQEYAAKKVESILGGGSNNFSGLDKVNEMLGTDGNGKTTVPKFDLGVGFGKRAFAGVNMKGFFNTKQNNATSNIKSAVKKVKDSLGVSSPVKSSRKNNTSNPFNTNISNLNPFSGVPMSRSRISMMFGNGVEHNRFNHSKILNPEKVAKNRMAKQHGLRMFGDFDRDKVLNIFDCDPLDPTKQGERHNPELYAALQKEELGLNTQPDSADADVIMGNTVLENDNKDFSVGLDINNDGVVNNSDNNMFNSMDTQGQMQLILDAMNKGVGNQNRNAKIYEQLLKTRRAELTSDIQSERLDQSKGEKESSLNLRRDQFQFQKDKYDKEQSERLKEKQSKSSLGKLQLGLQMYKYDEDKALEEKKLESQQKRQNLSDKLELLKFNEALESSERKDARQALRDDRQFKLQQQKLRADQEKGELALWENKLKAGSNMLGSLIGPGESLKGFRETVSGETKGTSGKGISAMSGTVGMGGGFEKMSGLVQSANNVNNMMLMSSGFGPQQSFGGKVMESIGPQQSYKPFTQKVKESVGKDSPEDLMQQQEPQPSVVTAPVAYSPPGQSTPATPRQQYYAPPPSQQVNVGYQQYPQPLPREDVKPKIDWDRVRPEQVAQYDPEYARYLAESESETTYRRGPYKKRKY